MIADDDAAQERPVACIVMVVEKVSERFRELVVLRVACGEHSLQAEDGWEGLQLDQARRERAILFAHQAKIGGHEVGMCRAMRDAEALRDCLCGGFKERS